MPINCNPLVAIVLMAALSGNSPAGTPRGAEAPPADVAASFAASEFATSGAVVPVRLSVANTSADTMSELRIGTNQLFTYRLDVAVPPGQVRAVAFAPWYFDGSLSLGGVADPLSPRPLPADTALLLFDPADVHPERLTDHLMRWSLRYFPPVPGSEPMGLARPEPVGLEGLTAPALKNSVAAAVVVSAERADLATFRRLAADAGKDLWTIDAAGVLGLLEPVPPALRQMAGRIHLRDDLLDLSPGGEPLYIPAKLFRIRSGDWPAGQRLKFMIPALVVVALLVCLAMLGWSLPIALKVMAALVILGAGVVWTLLAVGGSEFTFVDAVTVTTCDSPSGRALSEHLVSVSGLRRESVSLGFRAAHLGPPRPLMAADVDRTVYDGLVLHRDLEGRWSIEDLDVRPGLLLAFGATQWEPKAFPAGDVTLGMQSGRREVRLKRWRPLEDAYLYVGNRAYPMAGVREEQAYRACDVASSIDGAAYSGSAPAEPFRRRAMRWVARHVARQGTTVFFGWQAVPAIVQADRTGVAYHGRLVIWLVPEAGAL